MAAARGRDGTVLFLPAELVGHVRWLDDRRQAQEPPPAASSELVASIFGDLWLGQFLFTDDLAVCALLDWDYAGSEGALAEELAGLLFRSIATPDDSVPLSGPTGSFIRAYQAEFPLPPATWVTVGQRMVAGGDSHLLHHIEAWLRGEPRTRAPAWRERMVWRCRRLCWLMEHYGMDPDRWESALVPREAGIPGAAVGIVTGSGTEMAWTGVMDMTNRRPVDDGTVFQLGSITKVVTATAVLALVQSGLLELDSPVRWWLPGLRLPGSDRSLSVRHLLTHTAGWQGSGFVELAGAVHTQDGLERCLEAVAGLPQYAPPGVLWAYNNWGFAVLGRLVEVTTGLPFEQAIQDLVLVPLGMLHSGFSPAEVAPALWSSGHTTSQGSLLPVNPWVLPRSALPAGGLAASLRRSDWCPTAASTAASVRGSRSVSVTPGSGSC